MDSLNQRPVPHRDSPDTGFIQPGPKDKPLVGDSNASVPRILLTYTALPRDTGCFQICQIRCDPTQSKSSGPFWTSSRGRRIGELLAATGRLDLDLRSLDGRLGRGNRPGPERRGLRLPWRRVYERLSFAGRKRSWSPSGFSLRQAYCAR